MAKKKKNALVAAVLNFLWPGVGYLYAGKRKKFGLLVIIGFLIGVFGIHSIFTLLSSFILSAAFAYDVYNEIK